MSRVGKKPVSLPSGVEVKLSEGRIIVKGKLGTLEASYPSNAVIEVGSKEVIVKPKDESQESRAAWGLVRQVVAKLVTGVNEGFSKTLEINGVGYRASVDGRILTLALGYSHDIKYALPVGVDVECPKPTEITIKGADNRKVGQIAAEIRAFRPPEPYKGKGIKYAGETIVRKEGKKK